MNRRRILAEFPVDDILPLTNHPGVDQKEFVVGGQVYSVKMHSLRFECFQRSRTCVCCGIVGTKLILEFGSPLAQRPHFNLYGERDGKLVLLTKDHVIAASTGGSDCPNNLQTMCETCNSLKGTRNCTIDELRALCLGRTDKPPRRARRRWWYMRKNKNE